MSFNLQVEFSEDTKIFNEGFYPNFTLKNNGVIWAKVTDLTKDYIKDYFTKNDFSDNFEFLGIYFKNQLISNIKTNVYICQSSEYKLETFDILENIIEEIGKIKKILNNKYEELKYEELKNKNNFEIEVFQSNVNYLCLRFKYKEFNFQFTNIEINILELINFINYINDKNNFSEILVFKNINNKNCKIRYSKKDSKIYTDDFCCTELNVSKENFIRELKKVHEFLITKPIFD